MTSCAKMTAATPGRSIYLTFRHDVSKGHKEEVRHLGESRLKGSKVLAASLIVQATTPPIKQKLTYFLTMKMTFNLNKFWH